MQIESIEGFTEVIGRKKKNVKKETEPIILNRKTPEKNNNFQDEGFATASPTESEESLEVKQVKNNEGCQRQKSKNKKKRKKKSQNKNKPTCGYEAGNEICENDDSNEKTSFYEKHVIRIVPKEGCEIGEIQHRRRRISSRCNSEGEEICTRSIHWAPELVLEPSRVRTSSAGSILSKSKANYDDSSYECDCGVPGCNCFNMGNKPKWTSRSIRWKPRFSALASMKQDELNTIDQKFSYCDKQQHLKLGSGHTVYFGLTVGDGKEVCVRKLKTKQLPQLQPTMIKRMLALRHPNLLKYDQFCILKNQTYVLQEIIDYSLGRFLRDPSVCAQPIEKTDICRQLITGVKYLHSREICHTDIRPANILVTTMGRVVIANFGIAPMNNENKKMSIPKRVAEIKTSGPELWRAPETIWEIKDSYVPESDIPPLGMVIYTVMTNGKHPYGLTGRKETAPEALKNMLIPKYCLNDINDSVFAKEMIRQMLHKDPNQRPTLSEIQNAPFFWSEKQKLDHVKFILRGPKTDAIEKKHYRQLIPSAGHFGEMPDCLSVIRDANSGEEAIQILSDEYAQNPFDKDEMIQGNVPISTNRNFSPCYF
jgi:serine/threonine protein kinase